MKLSMLHLEASSPKHHHEGRLWRNELGLRCIAALGVDIGLIPWGIAWHFHHRSYGIDGIEMYLNFQPWVIHGYTKWIRGSNSAKSINPLIFHHITNEMTRKWGATVKCTILRHRNGMHIFFATWQDIATQSTILISKVGRTVSPKLENPPGQ